MKTLLLIDSIWLLLFGGMWKDDTHINLVVKIAFMGLGVVGFLVLISR